MEWLTKFRWLLIASLLLTTATSWADDTKDAADDDSKCELIDI